MINSFTKLGWTSRLLVCLIAILTAIYPLLLPLPALAALSSTFSFSATTQPAAASQSVSLLNFAISESAGGGTLNSIKLTVAGSPTVASADIAYCFLVQDTDNPSADVFSSAAGDLYWRWSCGTPGTATVYDLATDLDIDGVGSDTTMTPGIASLSASMTSRGTYEFMFGVVLSATPTNGNTFKLQRATGADGAFTASTGAIQTDTLQESAVITIDTAAPTVSGGGPANGQLYVPDQAMIDAVANEALSSGTVNTTNVTLYSCTGATDASSCTTPVTTSNLCTSVSLTSNVQIICSHASLAANTTFRFQIGTGVTDSVGNALASATTRIFRTSSVASSTNTTLPNVVSSVPSQAGSFPANGNITLDFPLGPEGNMNFSTGAGGAAQVGDLNYCVSSACAFSLKKIIEYIPSTEICTNSTTCATSWSSTTRRLTINPASNLEASSEYEMCLHGGMHALAVKNSASQSPPSEYCLRFSAVASDSTAPTLSTSSPTNPANSATSVSTFSSVTVRFSEALDQSTLSLSTVRLCADSTSGTAGCETSDTRLTD